MSLEDPYTSRHPAAILFDMDGTLVDSEKLWDVALQELAETYGGTLSDAARKAIIGTAMADSMRILHDDLGQPERDPAVSAAWIDARILELFRSGLRWRPGAMALLKAVRAAGIPTALVTSSGRPLVEVALETLGRDSFDVVVCGDEVVATKPHPEPYLTAARLLGVPIERCVAIEDSRTGVASALAAGAAVLAVPGEVPLAPTDGVHQLESLTAVDLELLAALLGEPNAGR
ncbi:haloacid dehalogenase superfamily, subfamily IA, variant 3 with third motif having DD or ED [Micromonospora avicenniae]|uniref:Haloacid dehalogenase superfamily, subfamily IA, variant 3 with third motif having DD or ED n=1 Tax=Micromonospora avicenniae TaxID=1198245 RepID=A0A1N7C945_9ACTN|nr:haloacid dehalogenase superfamily, subfamily IA, variant 3 with third motif having DD or ED [Micromonospora avicenniae]